MGSCVLRFTAVRTRNRLGHLILLIPCWEGRVPIPKRSEGPRETSNYPEAESSKALDLNTPNREEPDCPHPHPLWLSKGSYHTEAWGWSAGRNLVNRLYREEDLALKAKRLRRRRMASHRESNVLPTRPQSSLGIRLHPRPTDDRAEVPGIGGGQCRPPVHNLAQAAATADQTPCFTEASLA